MSDMMENRTVDFIIPCYNEAGNVARLYEAFVGVFAGDRFNWRLIMVDDGSRDSTFAELEALAAVDRRVEAIGFSRNFGKEAAVFAGLEASRGEFICIIDADLQQPPSVARQMLERLAANPEIDCVAAFQEKRREGWAVRTLKGMFYRVFAKAARTDMIQNASDFRVFRAPVREAILSMPEYHRFSKGIFAWVGFRTEAFPYTPEERTEGESAWSVRSLFRYAFEGLLAFTTQPLHFITMLGLVVFTGAIIYASVLIVRTLVLGIDVPGYASTTALILLFGGGQFLAIGIIGEYLSRMYIQGKHRPQYLVRRHVNASDAPKDNAV